MIVPGRDKLTNELHAIPSAQDPVWIRFFTRIMAQDSGDLPDPSGILKGQSPQFATVITTLIMNRLTHQERHTH